MSFFNVTTTYIFQDTSSSDISLPFAFEDSLELFLPRGIPEALDLLVLLNRALHRALDQRLSQEVGDENLS